jgi:hypothetical protein
MDEEYRRLFGPGGNSDPENLLDHYIFDNGNGGSSSLPQSANVHASKPNENDLSTRQVEPDVPDERHTTSIVEPPSSVYKKHPGSEADTAILYDDNPFPDWDVIEHSTPTHTDQPLHPAGQPSVIGPVAANQSGSNTAKAPLSNKQIIGKLREWAADIKSVRDHSEWWTEELSNALQSETVLGPTWVTYDNRPLLKQERAEWRRWQERHKNDAQSVLSKATRNKDAWACAKVLVAKAQRLNDDECDLLSTRSHDKALKCSDRLELMAIYARDFPAIRVTLLKDMNTKNDAATRDFSKNPQAFGERVQTQLLEEIGMKVQRSGQFRDDALGATIEFTEDGTDQLQPHGFETPTTGRKRRRPQNLQPERPKRRKRRTDEPSPESQHLLPH